MSCVIPPLKPIRVDPMDVVKFAEVSGYPWLAVDELQEAAASGKIPSEIATKEVARIRQAHPTMEVDKIKSESKRRSQHIRTAFAMLAVVAVMVVLYSAQNL